MTERRDQQSIRVILLDIEGTTTPVDFVYKTLFPFARQRTRDFLAQNWSAPSLQPILTSFREENLADRQNGLAPPVLAEVDPDTITAYVHWLMDRDRKSTPLKELQGLIWQAGYASGELLSAVYEDVPRALARWRRQGKTICIYSSGSVLAQKLLFSHTEAGDLSPYIRDYFDTHIGAKREAESYRRIAAALQIPPAQLLFLSDITAELAAAVEAGLQTLLCFRPGNAPPEDAASYEAIHSFDTVFA